MICDSHVKGNWYNNCFTFNFNVRDGEYYCSACEGNFTRDKFAIKPTQKVVRAWTSLEDRKACNIPKEYCVLVGQCYRCAEEFARYGCD
jgi:hypothetical protein